MARKTAAKMLVFKKNPPDHAEGSLIENLYETFSLIITAMIIIAFLFTFIFRPVGVFGHSKEDTLHDGDWLFVTPYYSEIEKDDIVIIAQPNPFKKALVKRVIALSGEKVDIDFDKGNVFVGDRLIDEPYINSRTTKRGPDSMKFPLTVPDGFVFVMGDNRNHSTDSRSDKIGFIKKEYIIGKARGRIFPPKAGWNIYE